MTEQSNAPELGTALNDRNDLEEKFYNSIETENDFLRSSILDYGRIDLLMTEVLGYKAMPCHVSMLKFQESHDHILILSPRGIGKSTCLTVVRTIYELLINPDLRILIVSNTAIQAEVFLREIKSHFEQNAKFIEVFGNLMGNKWDGKEINISTRKSFAKESNVSCIGVGGAIIGRHYDLIIGDDLVDEENSRTELQRERFKVWYYKVLDPTLEPNGRVYVHGTRYYPSDHYGQLIKSDDDYNHRVYPALRKVKPGTGDGPEENYISLWPEKQSVHWLLKKKKATGTVIFNSQYQNDTKAMEGAIFKYEWINYYDVLPDNLVIFQGIDLAISKQSSADYFCIATIGKDEFGRIFVIDVYKDRLSFLQQTNKIIEKSNQFNPRRVFIESNVYQKAQAELVVAFSDVPVKPVYTDTDKVSRAWKFAAKFENGVVFFPKFGVSETIDSLVEFPDGSHDDEFDALEIAVMNTFKRQRKKRREFGVL